jgi:probable HAF family extracellular repeat protein
MNVSLARAVALAGLLVSAAAAQAASIRRLDFVPWAVSYDGSVVVGATADGQAVRWTASGGSVGLGYLPGHDTSVAQGVSADGSVIIGHSYAASEYDPAQVPEAFDRIGRAFRWSAPTGMVDLGTLPGRTHGNARGVSADGAVVVGTAASANGPLEAFRWTAASGFVGLGSGTSAAAVSADGSVVIGAAISPSWRSRRWTAAAGWSDLPPNFYVAAVSADGSVVVGGSLFSNFNSDALLWTQATGVVRLDTGSGDDGAVGVSADGSVVVGSSIHYGAFLWDEVNGVRSLRDVLEGAGVDVSGIPLGAYSARGISGDGRTMIGGFTEAGETVYWVATVPEPMGLMPVICAAAGLLRPRRPARGRE